MLLTFRDSSNNIEAVCEWWLVDEYGEWTPLGEYVWVNQIECSKGVNLKKVFRDIIAEIAWAAPRAKGAYWERRDKKNDYLYSFTREALLNFKLKEEVVI